VSWAIRPKGFANRRRGEAHGETLGETWRTWRSRQRVFYPLKG
jgi:hypothetical protein